MSFQPQFDTHRYTDELAVLHAQSLVECRLPGSEIGSILAVSAYAVNTECVCADGEVRYSGKLKLCIVYEDGNHKACRAERGAEFYHKAEGGMVTPSCFAKTAFHIDNVTHRREGSGLYISVVVGATTHVFGGKQMEYLVGGENIALKKKTVSVCKTVCVSGETEGEDEFETDDFLEVFCRAAKNIEVVGQFYDIDDEEYSFVSEKGDSYYLNSKNISIFNEDTDRATEEDDDEEDDED